MIVLPVGAASNYYGRNAVVWNALQFAAVAYTGLSNLAYTCLKPIPFINRALPQLQPLPPVVTTTTTTTTRKRKVAIVTGSNTGIGFETSRALVEHGYEVVMACRSKDKATQAMERIHANLQEGAQGRAVFHGPLDLSDVSSIQTFSNTLLDQYDRIDVLVNNAGRNYGGQTEEGYDEVFFTNYLGHFLLTHNLLEPLLLKADNPRVVNLSSVMHHFCHANRHDETYWTQFAKPNNQKKDETDYSSYSPSKLAALLFSIELNRRYRSRGLRSIAVNPGAVNSDIWRKFPRFIIPLFRLLYLNNQQGSHTSVAAALSQDLPDDTIYLQPYYQPQPSSVPFPPLEMLGVFVGHQPTTPRLPNDGTQGALSAQVLWETSEKLLNMPR